MPGIVTNVTAFGCFVDVGVHQDGLVHISEIADRFISDPNEVVKVSQQVKVRVTSVDVDRKRISLSMKTEKMSAEKPVNRENRTTRPAEKKSDNQRGGGKPRRPDRGGSFGSSLNIKL